MRILGVVYSLITVLGPGSKRRSGLQKFRKLRAWVLGVLNLGLGFRAFSRVKA